MKTSLTIAALALATAARLGAAPAALTEIHLIANDWNGIPTNRPIDLVDEHYYNTPEFFIANADKTGRATTH